MSALESGDAPPLDCAQCGADMILTGNDVSHHVDENGDIDYDADADHVAYHLDEDDA